MAVWLLLMLSWARAAKVPVIINIGVGPSVGVVGSPGSWAAPSLGLSLQVEGWVSRRTLRSKTVRRNVPSQYRGMLKQMEDLHVIPLPLWVVPDTAFVSPMSSEGPALQGASWAPWSVQLAHEAKGAHRSLSLAPRVSWLHLANPGADAIDQAWLGASLDPEIQTKMRRRVGLAAHGSLGAGWSPEITSPNVDLSGVPWLQATGSVRLQIRIPFDYNL